MSRRLLIAGIGNIFQSDDAFGVEVVKRLGVHALPDGVRAEDFGIRGVHLAYELLEGYDAVIMIDAVPMGEPPGTLVIMEPELTATRARVGEEVPLVDAHTMSPDVVLDTLARLGGTLPTLYVLGCQPASLGEGMGLSAPVADVIDNAVELCLQLVRDIVQPARKGTTS